MLFRAISLTLMLFFSFSALADAEQSELLGKWKMKEIILIFRGQETQVYGKGVTSEAFDYSKIWMDLLEDSKYSTIDALEKPMSGKWSLEGSKFTMDSKIFDFVMINEDEFSITKGIKNKFIKQDTQGAKTKTIYYRVSD